MMFQGIFDFIVIFGAFSLGAKLHEKYPTAGHYIAFFWNAVELVAKGLFKLFGGTGSPSAPAAK